MRGKIIKYPRVWEIVENHDDVSEYTERLKVPGGWLVRIYFDRASTAVTFYPDPHHDWILKGKAQPRYDLEDDDDDD